MVSPGLTPSVVKAVPCIKACPKHLISFVPYKPQAVVRCSNCDKGASTMKVCKVGCIGCKKCERTCENDAIHVVDFHAVVDPEKCIAVGNARRPVRVIALVR